MWPTATVSPSGAKVMEAIPRRITGRAIELTAFVWSLILMIYQAVESLQLALACWTILVVYRAIGRLPTRSSVDTIP